MNITLPGYLGVGEIYGEKVIEKIVGAGIDDHYQLDMAENEFLRPYGVVTLVCMVRHLSHVSKQKVRIVNLKDKPLHYLDRMDFFDVCREWIDVGGLVLEPWSRNNDTVRMLELTRIANEGDVMKIVAKAEAIFDRWLSASYYSQIIEVLSELCSNIYQHSTDSQGCALIQTHQHGFSDVMIRIAVADMGIGIKNSLSKKHNNLGTSSTIDYLRAALNGISSRHDRGGLGLQTVAGIAKQTSGSFWLRSYDAALFRKEENDRDVVDLSIIQGTQLSIELHGSLY